MHRAPDHVTVHRVGHHPAAGPPVNLLGRADFFKRYVVQFWEAADMMNIDTSPDNPRPAP